MQARASTFKFPSAEALAGEVLEKADELKIKGCGSHHCCWRVLLSSGTLIIKLAKDHPQPWFCLLEVVFSHDVAAWITPEQTEPCLAA
jgi:hypothetical protein